MMESKRDGREFSKMKKITRSTTYFVIDDSEIPDGVLMEILLRLPLKPIFKFKCVSKRWFSVISDPYFVTSFLARPEKKSLSPAWDLLFCYMHNKGGAISSKDMVLRLSFKNHPLFNPRKFSLEFLTSDEQPQNQPIKVLATSNGLILCCKTQHWQTNYYICNPLTTQWISLPQPPLVHERVSIGFSSGDRSYRVVRIVQSSNWSAVLNLEIFTSDTGQWREQMLSCPRIVKLYLTHLRAIVYNEIMHWLAFHFTIIAYDPNVNSDHCRLINLPKDGQSPLLGVLGLCCERLCYLHLDIAGTQERFHEYLRLWVLKDYDSGEWFMRCKTPLIDIASIDYSHNRILSGSYDYIMPVAFHPFDTDTVYLCTGFYVASYNLRTKRLRAITDKLIPGGFVNDATVFPFVLPPWPTLIPRPIWSEMK